MLEQNALVGLEVLGPVEDSEEQLCWAVVERL